MTNFDTTARNTDESAPDYITRMISLSDENDPNGDIHELVRDNIDLLDVTTWTMPQDDASPLDADLVTAIHTAICELHAVHPTLTNYYPNRDALSHIAISLSLCPLHFFDWAICFDDDDPTCAQIRAIFPHHHDT